MKPSQDIKRPAPSSSATSSASSLAYSSSTAFTLNRPFKSAKLSSERRPTAMLGSPSSCLKSKPTGLRYHSSESTLPALREDEIVEVTSPFTLGTLEFPDSFRHVQFLPFDAEKSDGKSSYLPRTPYPMSSEENERILAQFSGF
ncbi:hypothetical protein BGZ99_008588 [Dissophora globulifera]|uniref:Uncharacterized protein n=1 Tax=Dissophora globulifera TaxID=979702 RepID=A0A9P6R7U7_9FUNG|nr:hypothetical protein BGZ99_008588 [Dissophora globulifera]